jgi:hypothetical protein
MPNTADTESPEACVHALYDVISGPPEQARDWTRFRALCRPDVRFLLASVGEDGEPHTQAWDLESFIRDGTDQFAARGLWEFELVGHTDRFGRIAHVFSVYGSRLDRPEAPVISRGVNSIQLIEEWVGETVAWRIVHLIWDRERAGHLLAGETNEESVEVAA